MITQTKLLGVAVTSTPTERILEYVMETIKKSKKKLLIVTPNPEMVMLAQRDSDFKSNLNSADIALPDGIGILLAAWITHKPIKDRIPGVDFMHMLCKKSVKEGVTIGLLGAGDSIAVKTADCLKRLYPGIHIAFAQKEWTMPHKPIDILFVAFGHPKQETWIVKHLPHIPVRVAMGVGGAFDYISGSVTRAPFFVRAIGFEWLYRLIRQPWRWRRQLALVEFILLVLRESMRKRI